MDEQIAPIINGLNAPFWAAATRGELILPHCVVTGRAFWPPSPSSPFAGGRAVAWRAVDPIGVVKAIATFHRGFQTAFEARLPYAAALVECSDGARLQVFLADPESIAIDDHVIIGFSAIVEAGPLVPVIAGKSNA